MRQFHIAMDSFTMVQAFVRLAMKQPFDVLVGNERQNINGKDLMGMFSLDFRFPQRVTCTCSEEEFCRFHSQAAPFLAN